MIMAKISHILLKNPLVVPCGTKLLDAVLKMKETGLSSVLVSRKNRLAGMISMDDFMDFMTRKIDWNVPVDEVMHCPELTINSDCWITDAIEMFETQKVSHLAVIENNERVGIMRANDILHTYRFKSKNPL